MIEHGTGYYKKRNRRVVSAHKNIHIVLGSWRTHEGRVCATMGNLQTLQELWRALHNKRLSCYTTAHGQHCSSVHGQDSDEVLNLSTIHPTGLTWPLRTAVSWALSRIRCRASTMQPISQPRKLPLVYELLKLGFVAKEVFQTTRVVAKIHRLGLEIL